LTTSYPCPRCGAPAALPDGCPACGAGPDPEAAEVIRLDDEIGGLTRELQEAHDLVAGLNRRLHDARAHRNQIAARVVARRQPVPTPGPVSPAPGPPAPVPPAAPAPLAEPVEPKLSTLTVQNVLFALGGLLLVVAAAVFTAVAWAQVGVTGRALLLAGATAAVLAVPPFAVRRGLTSAAETLAAVGLLMILLDGYAAWAVDLLWVREITPSGYAAAVLACTAAIAFGYSIPTRLRGPRIAALLMIQPVFPLLAAATEADLTGWSLAFTATAAADAAVLLLGRARPAPASAPASGSGSASGSASTPGSASVSGGTAVVAYGCGLLASAVAALLALVDLVAATEPAAAATAGLALVLPPAVILGWSLLARLPIAQSIAAGLLVIATGVAGTRWAWTLPIDIHDSSWQATRLALLTLLIAAAVALLPRTLPRSRQPFTSAHPAGSSVEGVPGGGVSLLGRWVPAAVGDGAWVGALIVGAASAFTVLIAAVAGAVRSVETSARVFDTPMDAVVSGPRPDMLVAVVLTASAYAFLLPRRTHLDLGLTASAASGFLIPAALGLPWWTASVAGVAVGAIALLAAARSRTPVDALYRIAVCLVTVTHAVIVGCGQAGVVAAVLGATTLLGVGTALALRNAPRGTDVGAGSLTVGLLTAPPAVWLALFTADVPVTGRVRVSLGIAALLCLVAHAINRRIPGYGPPALGVALLAAATTPAWSVAGDDPVALYAAAGLLLVVTLVPLPGARSGPALLAALPPGVALLLLTAPDLAVVLLEPWTALDDVWSGVPPVQSPVAWSGIAALAGAAVAAATAAWQVTRSPLPGAGRSAPHGSSSPTAEPDLIGAAHSPAGRPASGEAHSVPGVQTAGAGGPASVVPQVSFVPDGPAGGRVPGSTPTRTGTYAAELGATGREGTKPAAGPESISEGPAVGPGPDDPGTADTGTGGSRPNGSRPGDPETGGSGTGGSGTGGSGTGGSGTGAAGARRVGGAGAPALAAAWAATPFVAVIVPLIFAAAAAAWPTVPIAGLVTGLAGLLVVALAPVRHAVGNLLAVLFGALAAAGLAGSAAGHGATMGAFGLVVAAGVAAGLLGRFEVDRLAGWTAGSVSVVVLSYTIADLVDLGPAGPPLFVLSAAAVVIALEWALAGPRPVEARAAFVVGHGAALVALLLADSLGWAALVCKLWALVLTVRALRPGETRRTRFGYAVAAGSTGLAGWWFLLSSRDVETVEIYTLPAAVLAVIAGWFARRGRPELPSWTAYGPALAAAFLPTLAVIANSTADEPHYLRRLLLGAGALLVLLAGARARLQAPVVTGGGTLLLVALHELIQFWDLLPRWVPLAVGGLLLVGIATTMEQRRRDLARLRAAITRMA
jgi:hypothetical protein